MTAEIVSVQAGQECGHSGATFWWHERIGGLNTEKLGATHGEPYQWFRAQLGAAPE